jgi:hypothetical protein
VGKSFAAKNQASKPVGGRENVKRPRNKQEVPTHFCSGDASGKTRGPPSQTTCLFFSPALQSYVLFLGTFDEVVSFVFLPFQFTTFYFMK